MDAEVGEPPPMKLASYYYTCNECEDILQQPNQDCSGNRVCQACVDRILKKRSPSVTCPGCKNVVTENCFRNDKAAANTWLCCPNQGCDWKNQLKNLKDHSLNCQFRQVECGACSTWFPQVRVASHRSTCRNLLDYDGHVFTYNRSGLQETRRFPMAHYVDLFAMRFRNLGFAVGDRARSEFTSISNFIIDNIYQDSGSYNAAQETLVQFLRCNGYFYWKVPHFSCHEAKAYQGETTPICSSPFYASESRRYQMRLRLDINGYEEGKNSHMSLFLESMKGEYDGVLTWPLLVEVTFTLLNMTESENCTHTIRLLFTRPTAIFKFDGPKQFIGQQMVQRFIMDDTIFFKCEVKVIS